MLYNLKPWPNGFASRHKFNRTCVQLAFRLATHLRRLATTCRDLRWLRSCIYRWLAINLCRLELGGQTIKNLHRLAYEFELKPSHRKSTRRWLVGNCCCCCCVVVVYILTLLGYPALWMAQVRPLKPADNQERSTLYTFLIRDIFSSSLLSDN